MSAASNGEVRFQVVYSGKIEADIKALAKRANARGLGDKFHAAWRKIMRGLEYRPEEFGDPYTKLHALGLLMCHRAVRPLFIVFGIDFFRKIVYIQTVLPFPPESY